MAVEEMELSDTTQVTARTRLIAAMSHTQHSHGANAVHVHLFLVCTVCLPLQCSVAIQYLQIKDAIFLFNGILYSKQSNQDANLKWRMQ